MEGESKWKERVVVRNIGFHIDPQSLTKYVTKVMIKYCNKVN